MLLFDFSFWSNKHCFLSHTIKYIFLIWTSQFITAYGRVGNKIWRFDQPFWASLPMRFLQKLVSWPILAKLVIWPVGYRASWLLGELDIGRFDQDPYSSVITRIYLQRYFLCNSNVNTKQIMVVFPVLVFITVHIHILFIYLHQGLSRHF